jgi:superfamily II DNA or RNA helicase
MDQGYVSKLKIKCIVLKYPEDVCKENKKKRDEITKAFGPSQRAAKYYAAEIDLITTDKSRMNYIKKLTLKLNGNKLVFFRLRDHGNELTRVLEESSPNNVFYIDGGVKDRERIRKAIEDEENAILVASLGTTSTGTSIKKLHHMIAAAPQKSKTKVPQSIGRMLRLHKQKETAYLWDIVDDLSYKSYENYALQHFKERVKMYDADKFDYDIIVIQL